MPDKIKFVKYDPKIVATFRNAHDVFIEKLSKSQKNREIYLKVALEDFEAEKNLPAFLLALRNIATASGGIGLLAIKTNINRQSLYKALSPQGNPSFAMIDLVINSLGMKLLVKRGEDQSSKKSKVVIAKKVKSKKV